MPPSSTSSRHSPPQRRTGAARPPRHLPLAAATALALASLCAGADAATRTWNGACNTDNWSCRYLVPLSSPPVGTTNWSVLNALPADGDNLEFAGTSGLTNTNDITGLSIARLSFAANAGRFVLKGNALDLSGGITNRGSNLQTIASTLTVTAAQTWDRGAGGLSLGSISFAQGLAANALSMAGSGGFTTTGTVRNLGTAMQTLAAPVSVVGDQTWDVGAGGLTVGGITTAASSNLSIQGSGALVSLGNITHNAANQALNVADELKVAARQTWTGSVVPRSITFAEGLAANALNTSAAEVGVHDIGNLSGQSQRLAGRFVLYGGTIDGGRTTAGSSAGIVFTDQVTLKGVNTLRGGAEIASGALPQGLNIGLDDALYIERWSRVQASAASVSSGAVWLSGTGSQLQVSGAMTIGADYGRGGFVRLDEGASMTAGNLTLGGQWGQAALHVGTGGSAEVQSMLVWNNGYNDRNTYASATVAGAQASLTVRGDVWLSGTGDRLTVEDGGQLQVGGYLYQGGTQSRLTLRSGGLLEARQLIRSDGAFDWTGGTLRLTGATQHALDNVHLPRQMALDAGMTLDTTAGISLPSGAVLSLNGGTLKGPAITMSGGTLIAQNGLDLDSAGRLSGSGMVFGAVSGGVQRQIFASGSLTMGDLGQGNAYNMAGSLWVYRGVQVLLLSSDAARLGYSTQLESGATLATVNGAYLASGSKLYGTGDTSIHGAFTNQGAVDSRNGTLSFLNDVDGAGSFVGSIAFRSGYNPGNSPASIDHHGGDVQFDTGSTLTLEIFGNAPGAQYDQLVNIDVLSFNGQLNLVFGSGFTPAAGSSFQLFGFQSFAGALPEGRIQVTGFDRSRLDFSHLAQDGRLSVAAAAPVPEPGGWALLVAGLGALGLVARRRQRADTLPGR